MTTGYGFRIPNLPKPQYEYLKLVRDSSGLSPWQVVVLALLALERLASSNHVETLALVERVKVEFPKP